mmetsp:Transcript_32323/g.81439  ORF Transcript_32323/g.81439 Transcript_32323/m.81439 type:complete len:229 (-) Transcript_32323:445-1131(-)
MVARPMAVWGATNRILRCKTPERTATMAQNPKLAPGKTCKNSAALAVGSKTNVSIDPRSAGRLNAIGKKWTNLFQSSMLNSYQDCADPTCVHAAPHHSLLMLSPHHPHHTRPSLVSCSSLSIAHEPFPTCTSSLVAHTMNLAGSRHSEPSKAPVPRYHPVMGRPLGYSTRNEDPTGPENVGCGDSSSSNHSDPCGLQRDAPRMPKPETPGSRTLLPSDPLRVCNVCSR